MILTLPYKTKQFFIALIKLSIVVGAFYFVYHKLMRNDELEFHDFISFLRKNDSFSIGNIIFLLLLSIFNWFFEIIKWQTLVASVTPISFKNATEQSLGALTASLLTPNRIGEYGAKAIHYPKPLRKKIMLLNLIGNMMQMTATIIFGVIGLLFFVLYFSLQLNLTKLFVFVLTILILFGIIVFILNYFQCRIKGFTIGKIRDFVHSISIEIKIKGFLLSIFRYLIFSFQFYFLLLTFDVSLDYLTAMMVITTMYLLSSIVPSIFVFDVVIKGSVAVYLFSMFGVNDLSVLCIVTVMWFLNFMIPSVFGSYYVLNFNLLKAEDQS